MSHDIDFYPFEFEPLLVVISGPSGVGKDSVLRRMKERKSPFYYVVTATTRPPRADECEGVDYFFVSKARFLEMIEQDELLEYAHVYNDYKGIPKEQIRQALASRQDVVMRVDVQGAATVRKLCPEALLIFLTVENESDIVRRLGERKTDDPENLKLRIATARQELKRISEYDYVVPNREDQLDKTVDTILAIVEAEHHRIPIRKVSL